MDGREQDRDALVPVDAGSDHLDEMREFIAFVACEVQQRRLALPLLDRWILGDELPPFHLVADERGACLNNEWRATKCFEKYGIAPRQP